MEESLTEIAGKNIGEYTLTPEVFRLLQQANWDDIAKRLMVYAAWRAQYYGWLDSSHHLLSGLDFTIDDIVQEVIRLAIEGDREWDPSKSSLLNWLKYQVNSVLDAWIKSASGKHEVSFSDDEEEPEIKGASKSIRLEDVCDDNTDVPEQALLVKQITKKERELINRVFEAIADDPDLVALYDAIIETSDSRPRILAEALKTTTVDINNRKKRWARRISELHSSLKRTVQ